MNIKHNVNARNREVDLCMVVYLCPIKDSLLNGFSVKVQVRQSPDIPLECFLVMQQKW